MRLIYYNTSHQHLTKYGVSCYQTEQFNCMYCVYVTICVLCMYVYVYIYI